MAVFLLKLVFFAFTTLSNILTRLIFFVTAYLLVLLIQAFKKPGGAIHEGFQQVADVIKGCFEFIFQLVIEAVSSVISTVFDLVKDSITGSAAITGAGIGGLLVKTKTSLEEVLKDLPEVFEGFSEFISQMVADLWNNSKDALGYVTENA
ncbi:Anti-sigma-I factor RsgI6 like [Quillaja saponaria]|uniref:Anti-sigma-I factor RsgI6 like n=1 Tax=Quillaja saponaria TaxID=32244 RepID=A0AAD7L2Z8_QUISA|nr:Anti-sigma-I factor RsgI6 like [Quillaja saponaria]